jgi:hypothetical protein
MTLPQRIENIADAISESKDAVATVWEYTVSLSQLTIRISWPESAENLHIVCNACRRIEVSPAWGKVDLIIEYKSQDILVLRDDVGRFYVECGLIRAFRNVEPIYKPAQ